MQIDLYSVKGFSANALRHRLEEALSGLHVPFTLREIHEVDAFIRAGLESVPAVVIDDRFVIRQHNGSQEEMVRDVMQYIMSEKANTILVPVDFSAESQQGIDYATMMAVRLGMGITLVNVHQPLYDPVSAGALDIQMLDEEKRNIEGCAEKIRAKFADLQVSSLPVLTRVDVGEVSSSLIEILDQGPYEMMIIGTKASANIVRRLFGSVTSTVSRDSLKPVMVVPPGITDRFPGKIVVGFTEELIREDVLDYLLAFGAMNQVFFDFVHVTDDAAAFRKLRGNLFEKLVHHKDELAGFNIRTAAHRDRKVHDVLFEYAHTVRAGMVVLVSPHRTFFENLVHASTTRKALQHPELPLFIIHSPVGQPKS